MQSAMSEAEVEGPVESRVRHADPRRRPGVVFALGDGWELPEGFNGKSHTSHTPKTPRSALRLSMSSQQDVRCVVVRPEFAGGAGLRLVSQLRAQRPLLPILLQVGRADRTLLSLAYHKGFEISSGRDQDVTAMRFVERSLSRRRTTSDELEARMATLAESHSLTPSERRIANGALRGMSRADLLSSFDVSVNTLKSQTRSILKKTGYHSLNDMCRVVLMSLLSESA